MKGWLSSRARWRRTRRRSRGRHSGDCQTRFPRRGPGDSYHPDDSHTLPALNRRVHEAKREGVPTVTVWGTGSPRVPLRGRPHDLADACVSVLEHYSGESHLNAGSDEEVTIAGAAKVIDYRGKFTFDTSRPDGTPRNSTDRSSSKWDGGRAPSLREGLKLTYSDFIARREVSRSQI
jgi:GDP-L-fucose synthase